MSEMKDDRKTGQDMHDVSDDDPIDAEAEKQKLPRNGEDGNPSENGQSPGESYDEKKNIDLPADSNLSDKQGMGEPASEAVADDSIDVDANEISRGRRSDDDASPENQVEATTACEGTSNRKADEFRAEEMKNEVDETEGVPVGENGFKEAELKPDLTAKKNRFDFEHSNPSFLSDDGNESGTEEEQVAFMKVLENFFKERSLEFKPPKFYGEGLNCLKLWRAVTKLGGYDQVTSNKLWRQVGESFKPPKTCTTVSWSFRCFYEKALLEYERHTMHGDELRGPVASLTESMCIENQGSANQASGSGRARRDAAARAMQGWHSQRLLSNGEVGDPIIKDKNSIALTKREKQLKSIGLIKRKKPSTLERVVKAVRTKAAKPQVDAMVDDVGPPADWVKINVQRTKDCFEVYALVPGLLREEVRVQSDPAGRLVISGEPEQPDNPWGVTPFKKVVTLPSRIDPHQTSAVVTLHGQLFVRVPFERPE